MQAYINGSYGKQHGRSVVKWMNSKSGQRQALPDAK